MTVTRRRAYSRGMQTRNIHTERIDLFLRIGIGTLEGGPEGGFPGALGFRLAPLGDGGGWDRRARERGETRGLVVWVEELRSV